MKLKKGFLIYNLADASNQYEILTMCCVQQLRKHFASVPIACVVWKNYQQQNFNIPVDFVIPIEKTVLNLNIRNGQNHEWNNCYRVWANDITPFEHTVMVDADYVCMNKNLEWFFHVPFGIFANAKFVNGQNMQFKDRTMGNTGIDLFWATVMSWTQNTTTNDFWQTVKYCLKNWPSYAWLSEQPLLPIRFDHLVTWACIKNNIVPHKAPFDLYHNNKNLHLIGLDSNHKISIWEQKIHDYDSKIFDFFDSFHLLDKNTHNIKTIKKLFDYTLNEENFVQK